MILWVLQVDSVDGFQLTEIVFMDSLQLIYLATKNQEIQAEKKCLENV